MDGGELPKPPTIVRSNSIYAYAATSALQVQQCLFDDSVFPWPKKVARVLPQQYKKSPDDMTEAWSSSKASQLDAEYIYIYIYKELP